MPFRRRLLAPLLLLLALPARAAEPLTVSGQLLDELGRPAAGARAELSPAPDRPALGRRLLGLEPTPPPTAQTTTDAEGFFRLTVPSAGHWRLHLATGDGLFREETLPVVAALELGPLTGIRRAFRRIEVVDSAGRPVAGAWVTPLDGAGEPATTDPQGRAALPLFPGVLAVEVLVTRAGQPALTTTLRGGGSRLVLPALPDPAPTPMVLQDGAGRPVPDAIFWLQGQPVAAVDSAGRGFPPRAAGRPLTGIEVVATGRQTARFGAEGTTPRLAPPARLTGRVRSAAGVPLAGALVWPAGRPGEFTLTGAEGTFELLASTFEPAPPPLLVAAAGFVPLQVEPRTGTPVEVRLTPAATASGQVVDAAGRPLEGFLVSASAPTLESSRLPPPRYRTGDDGRFVLPGLTPGVAYELRALRPDAGRGTLSLPALGVGESRGDLKLPVTPFRVATGRVLDTEGEPVAGAIAVLSPVGELSRFLGSSLEEEMPAVHRVESGSDGRFRFPGLEPGRFDLKVRARGFAPVVVRGLTVTAKGSAADLGTVHLPRATRLSGRVVDGAGDPVPEAEVSFLENQGVPFDLLAATASNEVLTDPDGRFEIPDLIPGGTVNLTVYRTGYVRLDVPSVRVPREEELTLELLAAGRITGRVVDTDGHPVEGAQVATPDSRWEAASTDTAGAFTLEGLTPGTVQLVASARGYLDPPVKTIELLAGEEAPAVVFELERGAALLGRVTGPEGTPLAGAHVYVRDSAGFGPEFARTDDEGRYRLDGVPPGERRIAAGAEGLLEALRTVTVRAGENRLDFRLERGLHLRGRVVGPEGQTVDQGEVTATEDPSGTIQERAPVGPDGRFEIGNLKPGRYRVRADSLDFAPAELPDPVTVGPGSAEGVVVMLRRGATIAGKVLGLEFDELSGLQVVATSLDGGQYSPGQVDFRGGFVVKNVTPGSWTLIASVGNRQAMKQLDVEAGVPETRADIEFVGGYTLSGRVLRGGRPVTNAGILVSAPGELAGGYATTDHDGRFAVPDLAAGEYQLAVATNWSGFAHRETVAVDGDREVAIELVGLVVSARVADGDGEPLPNVVVQLVGGESDSPFAGWGRQERSDEAGRVRFTDVTPGRYRLQGQKEGFAQGEVAIEVAEADAEAELRLVPAPGLVLEIRSARGLLPAGFSVAAAAVDGQGRVVYRGSGEADERGRVRLQSLPVGTWTLWLESPGHAITRVPVTYPGPAVPVALVAGLEIQVEVPALRVSAESARLTVVGADGQALPTLHQGLELTTDRPLFFGRAAVSGVASGRWTLRVESTSGNWEKTVDVGAGTTRVVLE